MASLSQSISTNRDISSSIFALNSSLSKPKTPADGGLHSELRFSVQRLALKSKLLTKRHEQQSTRPLNAVTCSCASAKIRNRSTDQAASLYTVLELSQNVSLPEIKTAYRQMARRYHPDICPGPDREKCTEMFLQVQEAYEILSDPELRASYDNSLSHPFSAQAVGNGFPSSMPTKRRGGEARTKVSGAWKLQWEEQLNRLQQRQDSFSAGGSWGARMRHENRLV